MCGEPIANIGGTKLSIIKIENLSHIYSAKTPFEMKALDNINLEIDKGEFVGVIGHTGSGKSTLIQHLNGILKPTEGRILVDGNDIWASKKNTHDIRFDVGLVFQYPEYQLFEETVFKDIAYGPRNLGLSEEEIEKRVYSAAEFAGVKPEHLQKSPFELSGGQKRRVAIAGVIAMQPKVLILDEPTAGLDPKGRESILNRIKNYHKEQNNTVLLVSHNMEDIARFSDKILVMNKSKVWMYDTPQKVFSRANELNGLGLGIPQITSVFDRLIKKGVNVDPDVFTVKYAKNQILSLLKEGKADD